MKEPGDDKKRGLPPLIEELSQRPRKPQRATPKKSTQRTGDRPSLLDDVFVDRATRRNRQASRSEVEPPSGRGPSLLDDVFAPEEGLHRRVPAWAIVAALVVVFAGGLVVYRVSTGPVASPLESAVEAMTEPALETAGSSPTTEVSTGIQDETGTPPAVTKIDDGTASTVVSSPAPTSPSAKGARETPPLSQGVHPARATRPDRAGPTARARSADTQQEDKPKLLRGPEEPDDALQQKAFEVLREKSPTARQLVLGNLDQLRMIEWHASSRDGGQFLIDVIAEIRDTGQPSHFIWAVDPEKQTVRAMSQAARDLEAARSRTTQ